MAKLIEREISRIATEEINRSGIPSIQIAVGIQDTILFEGAYGLADIENNVRATKETKYRSASITKWWTATAIMILNNRGSLNLDEPIQKYCPEFPQKKWPVTSRHLLTHTAGIRPYLDLNNELPKAKNRADSLSIEQRYTLETIGTYTHYTNVKEPLDNFKDDSLLFQPGSNWMYSSQGYRVLGCILEGASGKSYKALMQDAVFGPAKMVNTVVDDSWAIIKNRASGYQLQHGDIRKADLRDVSENLSAGGYLTTAGDLVRFAMRFMENVFFGEETVRLMTTPSVTNTKTSEAAPSWKDAIPSKEKYGYGMMLFPDEEMIKIGHTGQQPGTSTIVYILPKSKIAIAVMTNAKGWNGYIDFTGLIEKVVANIQ